MLDAGVYARLAREAGDRDRIGRKLPRDDLERDRAPELLVKRAPDGGHSTGAGYPLEPVAGTYERSGAQGGRQCCSVDREVAHIRSGVG